MVLNAPMPVGDMEPVLFLTKRSTETADSPRKDYARLGLDYASATMRDRATNRAESVRAQYNLTIEDISNMTHSNLSIRLSDRESSIKTHSR